MTKSYKTDSIYFINNDIEQKKKMEDEGSGFVDRALKKYSSRVAYSYIDTENTVRHMTYACVRENIGCFKHLIGERRLMLILTGNNIESIIGYLSGISARTAVMLVRENVCHEILQEIIRRFTPDYIWMPKEPVSCEQGYVRSYQWNAYVLYEKTEPSGVLLNEELALLLPTSGTTGTSRYVKLSYRNIEDNTGAISDALMISEEDVTITSMPIYYTYGLSLINTYLAQGARVVLTERRFLQAGFWKLFRRENVTSVSGVPFFYEILFKMDMEKLRLSSLRVMTQAGGRLLPELQKYFAAYAAKNGIRFYVMYGQTEATARMTVLPYGMAGKKIGSVGLPVRGGKIAVDAGAEEQAGEIIYYGKNICGGYAYERDDLSEFIHQKYLRTGDRGFIDDEGYLYVCGRTDRMVKLHGNRIDLNELENLVFKKFGIVCRSSLKNNRIDIVISEEQHDLADYLYHITGLNRQYFHVIKKDEIPRNEYGKYIDHE